MTRVIPYVITGIAEYLCVELFIASSMHAYMDKHIRITVRDIFLGIEGDNELNLFFKTNSILMIHSGVVPLHITNTEPHRTTPRIAELQKSSALILSKTVFSNAAHQFANYYSETAQQRISPAALLVLQRYVEYEMHRFIRKASSICAHSRRSKLRQKDVLFAYNYEQI